MSNVNKMERFSPEARNVLTRSQRESALMRHNLIGTAHLLLAMAGEKNTVANHALEALDVDYARVLPLVRELTADVPTGGTAELAPAVKRALEDSVDEARRLGHHYVGTEHLLLGMMRRPDDVLRGLLERLGLSADAVRQQVRQSMVRLSENPAERAFLQPGVTLAERENVLRMLDEGKITAAEAADLLRALQMVAMPVEATGSATAQAVADARNRTARIVLRDKPSGATKAEIALPVDALQREAAAFFNLLHSGATGKFVTWETDDQLVEVYVD